MRNLAVVIIVTLVGVAQFGCSSAGNNLAAPRITVESLESLAPVAGQQRFRVGLTIDNPNPEPLPITSLRFTLRLAAQQMATIASCELRRNRELRFKSLRRFSLRVYLLAVRLMNAVQRRLARRASSAQGKP